MKECPTFTATIYCGLKEGYDGPTHTYQEVADLVQPFVDDVGLCVAATQTEFFYTNGREPGVIVGLINYPRFPKEIDAIRETAIELARRLRVAMGQIRVSVVFPDYTKTIGKEDESNVATNGSATCPLPEHPDAGHPQ